MIHLDAPAELVVYLGATGSGKTTAIRQRLKREKPARLLVFDPKGQFTTGTTEVREISALLDAARSARFAVSFRPRIDNPKLLREQFDGFCRVAYAAGKCTLVAEELALFQGRYPGGWTQAVLLGRDRGLRILGTSQRPAGLGRDFFGNCSVIRCGRLNEADDVSRAAKVLRVDAAQILALPPLHYLERDLNTGTLTAGRLKL